MWGRRVFCLNSLIHRVCLFPSLSVPTTITQKQTSRALTCSGPFLSFTLAVYPCVRFGIYFFCGFRAVVSHTLLAYASLSSFPPTWCEQFICLYLTESPRVLDNPPGFLIWLSQCSYNSPVLPDQMPICTGE